MRVLELVLRIILLFRSLKSIGGCRICDFVLECSEDLARVPFRSIQAQAHFRLYSQIWLLKYSSWWYLFMSWISGPFSDEVRLLPDNPSKTVIFLAANSIQDFPGCPIMNFEY